MYFHGVKLVFRRRQIDARKLKGKEKRKLKAGQNPFSLSSSKEKGKNDKKTWHPDLALTDEEKQERYRRCEEAKRKAHEDLARIERGEC